MLDHALGFLGREIQPVFPQVTVFQTTVLAEFLAVGQQGKQPGIATHQAFPGIQDAVVATLDIGAEIQRIAEHRRALRKVWRVDAQQRVAEHRRRTIQVGRGEHQNRAVRIDVGQPGFVFTTVHRRQIIQLQLLAQPAGTRRVAALRMLIGVAQRRVQGRQGRTQFGLRIVRALLGEEKLRIVDMAAPATQARRFVMSQCQPERLLSQLGQRQRGRSRLSAASAGQEQRQEKSSHGGTTGKSSGDRCAPAAAGRVRTPIRPAWRTWPGARQPSARPAWLHAPAAR